jgi:hypothetical protein
MSARVPKNAVSRRDATCAAITACAMPIIAPECWATSAVMPNAAESSPTLMVPARASRAAAHVMTAMSASGRLVRSPCTHESARATPYPASRNSAEATR